MKKRKYKGARKALKKLNGVKKGYGKQLKQLHKKVKRPCNKITKMGMKAHKSL